MICIEKLWIFSVDNTQEVFESDTRTVLTNRTNSYFGNTSVSDTELYSSSRESTEYLDEKKYTTTKRHTNF